MRFFNTAGPVNAADHYCIPPLTRFDLDEILLLIAQKKYFILHAPRQVGKTTYLLALMNYLNETGQYTALYVVDLGLITTRGQIRIANPIYQEVIPRELTYSTQLTITHQPHWYIGDDGRLQMHKLLTAFQQFCREHSESWLERFAYQEAGPQLLLQAFLQRIINGGGQINREYGLGHQRTDLLIIWPYPHALQRVVIETKLRKGRVRTTVDKGLEQTWAYMDRSGASEGHLIIFDREPGKSWEEKIFSQDETYQGRTIHVWGM